MRRRNSTVKVTKADGTTYEMPSPDRRSLKKILSKTELTDEEKAVIQIACPLCSARPGRECRTKAGRITTHPARTIAWRTRKTPRSDSGRIG